MRENDGFHSYGQTFEEFLIRNCNGSVRKFCKNTDVDENRVYDLLSQQISYGFTRHTRRQVAALLSEDMETLFPENLYRREIFQTIREAPGYQLLATKYKLSHGNKHKNNLHFLFFVLELSESDYIRFVRLLLGIDNFGSYRKWTARIAATLEVEIDDLFPPHIYCTEPHRIPYRERSRYILDEPEAQQHLHDAVENNNAVRKKEIQQELVQKLLQELSAEERKFIEKRFFQGKTLQETGVRNHEDENVSRENMRQVEAKILNHLRRILQRTTFEADLLALKEVETVETRVFM